MLYTDNEYINECNYKIHYDCLKEYLGQTTEFTSYSTIYEDKYYTQHNITAKIDNVDKIVRLFIIKYDNDVNIEAKVDGLKGSVIKKIAPGLYKYIKITNSTLQNQQNP